MRRITYAPSLSHACWKASEIRAQVSLTAWACVSWQGLFTGLSSTALSGKIYIYIFSLAQDAAIYNTPYIDLAYLLHNARAGMFRPPSEPNDTSRRLVLTQERSHTAGQCLRVCVLRIDDTCCALVSSGGASRFLKRSVMLMESIRLVPFCYIYMF